MPPLLLHAQELPPSKYILHTKYPFSLVKGTPQPLEIRGLPQDARGFDLCYLNGEVKSVGIIML